MICQQRSSSTRFQARLIISCSLRILGLPDLCLSAQLGMPFASRCERRWLTAARSAEHRSLPSVFVTVQPTFTVTQARRHIAVAPILALGLGLLLICLQRLFNIEAPAFFQRSDTVPQKIRERIWLARTTGHFKTPHRLQFGARSFWTSREVLLITRFACFIVPTSELM